MNLLTSDERKTLLRLARISIEDRLRRDGSLERALAPPPASPGLVEPRACFVTLHLPEGAAERLRGCVGSLEPRDPLFRSVVENARQAAFHDPRFPPLGEEDLARIVLSVSVLTPVTPIDGPGPIVLGRDGVVFARASRRSVFLPEVAVAQGWTVEELLENLALKAGLDRRDWRGAELSTFQTEVFGEAEGGV
jgi:AmmeMemoRadiSam system protein A